MISWCPGLLHSRTVVSCMERGANRVQHNVPLPTTPPADSVHLHPSLFILVSNQWHHCQCTRNSLLQATAPGALGVEVDRVVTGGEDPPVQQQPQTACGQQRTCASAQHDWLGGLFVGKARAAQGRAEVRDLQDLV
jgi:hypothetical protein